MSTVLEPEEKVETPMQAPFAMPLTWGRQMSNGTIQLADAQRRAVIQIWDWPNAEALAAYATKAINSYDTLRDENATLRAQLEQLQKNFETLNTDFETSNKYCEEHHVDAGENY